jgi:hypothetical protein
VRLVSDFQCLTRLVGYFQPLDAVDVSKSLLEHFWRLAAMVCTIVHILPPPPCHFDKSLPPPTCPLSA